MTNPILRRIEPLNFLDILSHIELIGWIMTFTQSMKTDILFHRLSIFLAVLNRTAYILSVINCIDIFCSLAITTRERLWRLRKAIILLLRWRLVEHGVLLIAILS